MNVEIIFFDGVCGLCNRFVDFIISKDHSSKYKFAPLQGKTFQQLKVDSVFPDSVVFFSNNVFLTKSNAALAILIGLGGWYKLSKICYIFPVFFRDFVYDFIAQNRYKWFGKKETCRLPSPEERLRFLD